MVALGSDVLSLQANNSLVVVVRMIMMIRVGMSAKMIAGAKPQQEVRNITLTGGPLQVGDVVDCQKPDIASRHPGKPTTRVQ
jgi:hypothetical protein